MLLSYSPSQSFILDLDDENWQAVFSKQEIEAIKDLGEPLLTEIPEEIEEVLTRLRSLVCMPRLLQQI